VDRLVYVMQQPQPQHIHGYPVDWYRPAAQSPYAIMGQQRSDDYRRGFAVGALSTMTLAGLAWLVFREARRLITGA